MNVMRVLRPSAGPILIAILLVGCATQQPIPELSHPQSAGLAIDVALKAPIIRILSYTPAEIFFAKIDGKDGLFQQQIIRSNYVKSGRAYLLNAQPGTYVAVAAFYWWTAAAGATYPNTTYFSKEAIEQSKVTVRESDFVFMGNYVFGISVGWLEGADELQTHYKNVIARGGFHRGSTLIESKNDEQTRSEFFKNAKEDLAGSTWATRLK